MNNENQSAVLFGGDATLQAEFAPIFGNLMFQVDPSRSGEVNDTFGTVPYVSLEGLIQRQIATQVDPGSILPGQNTGQQNIQGSYTVQDSNGLPRMVMGYEQGGF